MVGALVKKRPLHWIEKIQKNVPENVCRNRNQRTVTLNTDFNQAKALA